MLVFHEPSAQRCPFHIAFVSSSPVIFFHNAHHLAAADNWHEQVHQALEGTKAYSLHVRLLRVRDVSTAHAKAFDLKAAGSRKSEKMKRMSGELANLFQANGLDPYRTVSPDGEVSLALCRQRCALLV